ncbi:MAG TPA: BrnT family toxin [Pyrinomonadaceae bacterium]|nr:BrnT family toxin [Pyrinomonadaceae bacterium]
MTFEWDEEKNRENIRKHGIDFIDAWQIFEGPVLDSLDLRADYGEDRWIGFGMLDNRVVVVTFTEQVPNRIRIISLRKALRHERTKFEEALKDGLEARRRDDG